MSRGGDYTDHRSKNYPNTMAVLKAISDCGGRATSQQIAEHVGDIEIRGILNNLHNAGIIDRTIGPRCVRVWTIRSMLTEVDV